MKRLTVISAPAERSSEWTDCFAGSDFVTVPDFASLAATLRRALHEEDCDIERVIIDGVVPAVSCLEFLATLPSCFSGDVLFVALEGKTFLSATGRGGDRILYMLDAADVEFYLQTYGFANRGATVVLRDVTAPQLQNLPVRSAHLGQAA